MGEESRTSARAWTIAAAFVASTLASIGLGVVYALGGQVQLEGLLLGIALGGVSVGIIAWAKAYMPHGPHTEARQVIPSEVAERPAAEKTFVDSAQEVGRRGLLGKLLAAAIAALGAVMFFPIRSLGERPGRALFHTAWRRGARLVTRMGTPVRAEDVAVNTVLTVFPEGHTEEADSQTLLIRLPRGSYEPQPGREEWSPRGFVAFSKVCTHAGCPVGLYQPETRELFCPCHQSIFDVGQAAKPSYGPATRALPQLPLGIDGEGYLIALGDFSEPVGPGFWSLPGG